MQEKELGPTGASGVINLRLHTNYYYKLYTFVMVLN